MASLADRPGATGVRMCGEVREVDRQARPNYAVWETTLRCDQACRHCGSRAGRERVAELTTAERLDLVDQLADLGVLEVTLTGGETYLRDDWLDLVRAIRARGMECTLVTAGRGVTPELARAAADAGLQGAAVSIDGHPATHDKLRGRAGSYRGGLAALELLADAGLAVSVNTQVNRRSLAELADVLEVAINKRAYAWQIQLTFATGRAADLPELILQPWEILDLFAQMPALKQRCDEAGVTFFPADNIGYFGPHEALLRGDDPCGHFASCGAGRGVIGIEADGTIKPCASLATATWGSGSVRDHRLVDIWQRSEPMRYTRARSLDDLWGWCRSCYYAEVCMGGCTSAAFLLLGKPGNNPYCHHRALELHRQGKRERLVLAAPAPGLPLDRAIFDLVVEDR